MKLAFTVFVFLALCANANAVETEDALTTAVHTCLSASLSNDGQLFSPSVAQYKLGPGLQVLCQGKPAQQFLKAATASIKHKDKVYSAGFTRRIFSNNHPDDSLCVFSDTNPEGVLCYFRMFVPMARR